MKTLIPYAFAIPAIVASFVSTSHAEDSWSKTVAFSRSDASAIKVFEPEGYKASITIDGNTISEEVPVVLKVPNGDAFYSVTITAPNGVTWKTKVETKKFFVTELHVKHGAAAGKGAAKPMAKYFGKIRNTQDKKSVCAFEKDVSRIDFVDSSGAVAASANFSGKQVSIDLPAGEYTIRTFRVDPGQDPIFRNSRKGTVSADGWQAAIFCSAKGGGFDVQFYSN